jgi:hypothetical protein
MNFEEFDRLPDAVSRTTVLFSEIREVKARQEKLPDDVAAKVTETLAAKFVPREQCVHLGPKEKREEPAPFWPKTPQQWIFAAITLGFMIGGALGLIPVQPIAGQPQPPAITAPTTGGNP